MKFAVASILLVLVGIFSGQEIKVSPESFNFGRYPANQEKKHTFSLTNTGDQNLLIDKIRSTCGCAVAEIDKKDLKPGESTEFEVKILKESIGGPFSKGIFIHSNSKTQKLKMITLSGESVPLVTVLPQQNIYMGTLQPGKQFIQEFILDAVENVKFSAPDSDGNFKPDLELSKINDKQYKLRTSWLPSSTLENAKAKILIKIESPADWNPIELNLHGLIKKR